MADPGPAGRAELCALAVAACSDPAFIAAHLGDDVSARDLLYEDPDLGFCIFAHLDRESRQSLPHDHGPTWVIYAQAEGETIMTDWRLVTPRDGETPGTVEPLRQYTLTPGTSHLYNEGDIHSPLRLDTTRLIRIEGRNIKLLPCDRYEPI